MRTPTAKRTGQATEPLPLYHRIYLLLRQMVSDDSLPDGKLPGEHELASRHGVSRITVRRAMQQLEAEQLVERRRGSGTFVHRRRRPAKRREALRDLMESLLDMGEQTEVRLVEFGYAPAPPVIAAALEVRPGAVVQKSVRVRSAGNTPFSHLTCWVPEDVGRHYGPDDLARRPLLRLLEEAGAAPAAASQVISAQLADSLVAPLLAVPPGSALIRVTRDVRDASGRVIEMVEALYRPDMYEYQFGLVRQRGRWGLAEA